MLHTAGQNNGECGKFCYRIWSSTNSVVHFTRLGTRGNLKYSVGTSITGLHSFQQTFDSSVGKPQILVVKAPLNTEMWIY